MAEEANTNGTQQISDSSTTPEPAGALSGGGDPKSNAAATEPKTVSNNEHAKIRKYAVSRRACGISQVAGISEIGCRKASGYNRKSQKKQNKPLKKEQQLQN